MKRLIIAILLVLWVGSAIADSSSLTIGSKPKNLSFHIEGDRRVVTITAKGEIEIGEGYSPTEAGATFLKALAPQLKAMMDCK